MHTAMIVLLATVARSPQKLDVTSTAFDDNSPIPSEYTCEGAGVSPPLAWSAVPTGTQSIAILVDDPDAPLGTVTQLLVTGIDPHMTSIDAGVLPPGAVTSTVQGEEVGYVPPCPTAGKHHYQFRVYALDTTLPPHLDRHDFIQAVTDHILATGELVGTYAKRQNL